MGDLSPTWVRPSSSPWTVTNQQDSCHREKQPCSYSLFMVWLLCAGSNPTALQGMATDLERGCMWGQWQAKLRVEWPPHRAYGGLRACAAVSAGKAGSAGTALEPITHYSHSKTCVGGMRCPFICSGHVGPCLLLLGTEKPGAYKMIFPVVWSLYHPKSFGYMCYSQSSAVWHLLL